MVVFNYGGNDAKQGLAGLPRFTDNMQQCVAKAQARGARVALLTPQGADARKSGAEAAAQRIFYAETMLSFGRTQGWTVVDVHHPLEIMQKVNEKDDPAYTILKDKIHLTNPAYIAWGFLFYDRLDPPFVRSAASLMADGRVTSTENCAVLDVDHHPGVLSFNRFDDVLPILPPGPLPPRLSALLEPYSRYLLTVTGLAPGKYEIRCDGQPIGEVDDAALAVGVNLNTLLLDGGREAPWASLAQSIWEGERLDQIGKTSWRFEIRMR